MLKGIMALGTIATLITLFAVAIENVSEAEGWDVLVRMFPSGLEDEALAREIDPKPSPELRLDELADLLGRCLWDVFSDNHEVTTSDGSMVDLGSFRSAAGVIAEFRASHGAREGVRDRGYDYLDFYMGSMGIHDPERLRPIYRVIFSRMRRLHLDWRYVHPRLYLINLGNRFGDQDREDATARYDPSEAVALELERRRHDEELAELRARLDKEYERSIARARRNPPPVTVQAYRDIYGQDPVGWPPGT